MRIIELSGDADTREQANWSGASAYFRQAQEIAAERIARARSVTEAEKREWSQRLEDAFSALQMAFSAQRSPDTYRMKNAALTVCHYVRAGRKAMPLKDVEANIRHLAGLIERRAPIPHPSENLMAVDADRRSSG